MHVQKTWDGIMNAPVNLDDIVLAEMLWAAFKSLFTVTAILGVMLGLGISQSPKLLLAWPSAAGGGHHLQLHSAHLQRAGQGV
jgi:lipooligosaccharide transport system permease protein